MAKYPENKEDSCYCSKYENTSNSPTKSHESNRKKSLIAEQSRSRFVEKGKKCIPTAIYSAVSSTTSKIAGNKLDELKVSSSNVDVGCRSNDLSDTCSNSSSSSIYSKYNDKDNASHSCEAGDKSVNNIDTNNVGNSSETVVGLSCDYCANVHNDCGYGSADNIISSSSGSGESSVDSSEVACSEGFCNHDGK